MWSPDGEVGRWTLGRDVSRGSVGSSRLGRPSRAKMEELVEDVCDFSPAKRARIDVDSASEASAIRYELRMMEKQPDLASPNSLFDDSLDCERLNDSSNADDEDDVASTVSNLSGLSDLSNISGLEWKPITGAFSWAQKQMELGMNPRSLLQDLVPLDASIPADLDDITLWKIVCDILTEPPRRKKLSNINTLDDVIELLRTKEKIIVLTGAGVSVSCGIPDFRSRDGIYARLAKDFPDLPDPQAMFDIHYFRKDPRPFYKFAKEIYPGQFDPSLSHRFIKLLEKHGKLLRNYSQNIDTLEQIADIERVIQCHGSFATATCTKCCFKVDSHAIKDDIFKQNIPKCPKCGDSSDDGVMMAVMKPDIVFFGEGLADEFHSTMAQDKDECDLLIVIGSSLKVRPVALIPHSVSVDVPQILINREPLKHVTFDVELLGDCDVIINEICLRLGAGWNQIARNDKLHQIAEIPIDALTKKSSSDGAAVSPASPDKTSEELKHLHNFESSDVACEEHVDMFRSKNISCNIPAGSYVFSPPNCYLFNGAEIVAAAETAEKNCCVSRTEIDQTDASASGEDSGVGDLRDDQHL